MAYGSDKGSRNQKRTGLSQRSMPLISVLMAVRNGEDTVERSIRSILDQTLWDFEFIIVDDASEDKTLSIIKRYESCDRRVKLFALEKHVGLTAALNFGLKQCQGSFVARQDADDFSYTVRLEHQILLAKEQKLDCLFARAHKVVLDQILPGPTPRFKFYIPLQFALIFFNPVIHGTFFVRKEIFDRLSGYDEKFEFAQDYDFLVRVVLAGFKMKMTPRIL